MLSQLQKESAIAAIRNHTEMGYTQIAEELKLCRSVIVQLAKEAGLQRPRGGRSAAFRHTARNNEVVVGK